VSDTPRHTSPRVQSSDEISLTGALLPVLLVGRFGDEYNAFQFNSYYREHDRKENNTTKRRESIPITSKLIDRSRRGNTR